MSKGCFQTGGGDVIRKVVTLGVSVVQGMCSNGGGGGGRWKVLIALTGNAPIPQFMIIANIVTEKINMGYAQTVGEMLLEKLLR